MIAKAFVSGAVLVASLAASAPLSTGKAIVEHGTPNGAPPCASCHGGNLAGNPAIKAPALAGLSSAKILDRLAHYASPQGHNAAMRAVATALTASEKLSVAAYISSLRTTGPSTSGHDPRPVNRVKS